MIQTAPAAPKVAQVKKVKPATRTFSVKLHDEDEEQPIVTIAESAPVEAKLPPQPNIIKYQSKNNQNNRKPPDDEVDVNDSSSDASAHIVSAQQFNNVVGQLHRDPAIQKFADFQEVLDEDTMNNNAEDVFQTAQGDEIITTDDFNEEDFDEGPGPGVYFPSATINDIGNWTKNQQKNH